MTYLSLYTQRLRTGTFMPIVSRLLVVSRIARNYQPPYGGHLPTSKWSIQGPTA